MHLKKAMAAAAVTLLTLSAGPALAQGFGKQRLGNVGYTAGYAQDTNVTGDSLPEMIGNVIQVLLSLIGAIFLVLMVYAGYLWMTARGDSKAVEKAKDIIKQAIIGIIIVTMAYAITGFVVSRIDAAGKATSDQPSDTVTP